MEYPRQWGARIAERRRHPLAENLKVPGGIVSFGDAGLIRYYDELVSSVMKPPAGRQDVWQKVEIRYAVDMPEVRIDDAVTVEEESFMLRRHAQDPDGRVRGLRGRQCRQSSRQRESPVAAMRQCGV